MVVKTVKKGNEVIMDTRTGELYNMLENGDIEPMRKDLGQDATANDLSQLEKEDIKQNLIPVRRNLSIIEKANRQIMLYQPCACGSGKKFKFCCFKK